MPLAHDWLTGTRFFMPAGDAQASASFTTPVARSAGTRAWYRARTSLTASAPAPNLDSALPLDGGPRPTSIRTAKRSTQRVATSLTLWLSMDEGASAEDVKRDGAGAC